MQKIFKNFTALIIVGALIFVFREELQNIFFQLRDRFLPCGSPISYSIGIFDERFGISRKNFLADTKQAEEIVRICSYWRERIWLPAPFNISSSWCHFHQNTGECNGVEYSCPFFSTRRVTKKRPTFREISGAIHSPKRRGW